MRFFFLHSQKLHKSLLQKLETSQKRSQLVWLAKTLGHPRCSSETSRIQFSNPTAFLVWGGNPSLRQIHYQENPDGWDFHTALVRFHLTQPPQSFRAPDFHPARAVRIQKVPRRSVESAPSIAPSASVEERMLERDLVGPKLERTQEVFRLTMVW